MPKPVYHDADTALYLGDCSLVLPILGIKPDLILTSPPYDGIRSFGGHAFNFEQVADALTAALPEGALLVWIVADATVKGSESGTSFRHALGFLDRGLNLHDTMIYERSSPTYPRGAARYGHCFDYMFIFSRGKPKTFNPIRDRPNKMAGAVRDRIGFSRYDDGSRWKSKPGSVTVPEFSMRSNIWEYAIGLGSIAPDYRAAHKHPAIFPYQLAYDHIRSWTNPGDLVLDPMAGSGTVLRAAKDLGRRSVGIEIHKEYCQELIVPRLGRQVFDIF